MTTRRQLLQAGAALPLIYASSARAAPDPERLALVIGNGAYRLAPLANPGNDARAVAALLDEAGFTVSAYQNAPLADMRTLVQRFATAATQAQARQVIFYYAGHGVQLDWRNYLLPVDAEVTSAEQVRERCIDLNQILEQFAALRGKNFIIVLDACRNNPFGSGYQPTHKGLSQFDAPVGSLIAYATAPGSVAADGDGKNGLYTEHLVRELARKNTRIEDALKRVRLNVRLASKGAQIPWETTSLEDDVFLFPQAQTKRSDAELEQELKKDIAAWERIRDSDKADDWVAYLREFPDGHFAESAQQRLSVLLGEARLTMAAASRTDLPAEVPPEPAVQAASPQAAPAIELGAGASLPARLVIASPNPYSAGRYPLGWKFTVGDERRVRVSDWLTGVEQRVDVERVTKVDEQASRVEINDGESITDMAGTMYKNASFTFPIPLQLWPGEIYVGKKWRTTFTSVSNDNVLSHTWMDGQVKRVEQVTVPAGTFDAFVIEMAGYTTPWDMSQELVIWMVPGIIYDIKRELMRRNGYGRFVKTERLELVSLRQHATGI